MMNNKERIAKWQKLHKRTKLALTHEIAGLILDMLEQQQTQLLELTNSFEVTHKELASKYIALCNDVVSGKYESNTPEGSIYNEKVWVDCQLKEITDPLFTTMSELLAQRDLEQQIKALESLLLEVQWSSDMGEEVVTGNEIDSRMYRLKEQLKNGGEL